MILADGLAKVPADSHHQHPDMWEKLPPNDSSPKLLSQPNLGIS